MTEGQNNSPQMTRRDFLLYGAGGSAMYALQIVFPRLAENVATFSEWERGFYDDATNPQAEFSPLYATLAQIPTLSYTAAENDPPSEVSPNFVDLYREADRFEFGKYGRISFQGMEFRANAVPRGPQDSLTVVVAVDPRIRRVQGAQLKNLIINPDYDVSVAVMQAELIGYDAHSYIAFHLTAMTTEMYPQKGFTDVMKAIRRFRAQSASAGRAPAPLDKVVIIDLSQKDGNQSVNGTKDPINMTITSFQPTKVKGHILWEGDYQSAMQFLHTGKTRMYGNRFVWRTVSSGEQER